MKKLLVILALTVAVPCVAQPPKPGPEVQKLACYVGMWKFDGEIKAGLFFPSGKYSVTGSCDWFAGGFHVVCRSEGTGPAGTRTELSILAYDAEAKTYTYHGISSFGDSNSSKGSVVGNTWTYLWDSKAAGRLARFRYTEVHVSPTVYTFKLENAVAGGPWTVIEEGKATKIK